MVCCSAPHVFERCARVVAEMRILWTSYWHRNCSQESEHSELILCREIRRAFVRSAIRVLGETGSTSFQEAHALGDIVEEFAFVWGRSLLTERFVKSGPGHRVRHCHVAGQAKSSWSRAACGQDIHQLHPLIEVGRRCFLDPTKTLRSTSGWVEEKVATMESSELRPRVRVCQQSARAPAARHAARENMRRMVASFLG